MIASSFWYVGEIMATRKYAVLFEAAEEGGFVVKSTELPVASEGETREEALRNIKEAITVHLEDIRATGEPLQVD